MFVRFNLDSKLLQHALSVPDGMQASVEQFDTTGTIPLRVVFWVSGGDFETFEDALDDDPTVVDSTVLATEHARRLYRVTCPEGIADAKAYTAAIERDGVILNATSDGDGWTVKTLFPDRESFAGFRDVCEEVGLTPTVESIHSDTIDQDDNAADLTPAQKEILTRAVEVGYFDIPRQTTLRGLGADVGVSGQAASERLRRGMETLVRETLADDLPNQ
ncbi:helix-turn-helix domain-containing protein [Haloarchaeobius sp. HME9146]|uniref:helix-turn-helix domain-containing protein n=1 Tax=Haloarchaeobius sp. HME9146 TaxID=2978732 RepID=UPI0021C18FBE|nr:helix-turn-helix domain-containing protein [Haloarchaeobius sp. HME9146]MCT9095481.1 helix-turn-helix domain-containing protein [Haloarchaeobius sp. HME9146]